MLDEFVMPDRAKLEVIADQGGPGTSSFIGMVVNGLTIYEVDQVTPLTKIVDTEDVYVDGWGFFKVNAEKVIIENLVLVSLIEWCPVRNCYAATCFLDIRRIALCEF